MNASIDTLGLVVVRHTWEIRPEYAQADGISGPEHYQPITLPPVAIREGETVGELLARVGLEEGDAVEIRFQTVAEQTRQLFQVLETTR